MNLQPYRKAIVAILVPVVGFGLQALGVDVAFGEAEAQSLMNVLVPMLTVLGVWAAPNKPA